MGVALDEGLRFAEAPGRDEKEIVEDAYKLERQLARLRDLDANGYEVFFDESENITLAELLESAQATVLKLEGEEQKI